MTDTAETYVLLELAGGTYAIPSSSVQHIEMLEHITPVPNAYPAIDGVVFSRGQVIPALNLRVRFGFPRREKDLRTRVIFAQLQQRIVGLIVDSAREFRKVPASRVRPIQETLTGVAGNYLKGLTTLDDRLVLILDLEAVLALEKDEPLANSLADALVKSNTQPALCDADP
jgi:purine-binding chemotaxis protein CheW